MKNHAPTFSSGQIEAICKVLGDTDDGLTGAEISRVLTQIRIPDTTPGMTKWKRLYNALAEAHNRARSGDRILAFISVALEPARFAGRQDHFDTLRSQINVTLALVGLEFRADGKFYRVDRASTLSEAEQRAHRLRAALSQRGVHDQVIRYCRSELLQYNHFHAVLEAAKGVGERLRQLTGLTSDGAELVDASLSGDAPLLRINAFITDSERGEQRGFVNLLKGLFGTFRNPTAHAPKIVWPVNEADALDLLSLCSYVHRRLDGAPRRIT